MQLKNQVCNLKQAKLLKDLGIPQESLFSWFGDENHIPENSTEPWIWVNTTHPINNQEADHRADIGQAKPIAAAFTVGELGQLLPLYYHSWKGADGWIGFDENEAPFPDGGDSLEYPTFSNEAECRAEMLIKYIRSGRRESF